MMSMNSPFIPSRFETNHCITLHGQKIDFTAIAEDFVFYGEDTLPEASLFSYTYLRRNVKSEGRPVIFAWNGGPGSCCIMEHTAFFGPWRIPENELLKTLPPFTLEENPNCLLDRCDIVLIDPVDTGYGRLINRDRACYYFSIAGDAKATADFIEAWLTKYDRWNSPIYLMGESYGTIRCARVAEELNGGTLYKNGRHRSIAVSGMVLIGNATWLPTEGITPEENAMDRIVPEGTQAAVLLLPTMAAANWYHHPERQTESLDDFCDKAYAWAWNTLEPVLSGSKSVTDQEKKTIAEEMSSFTGIACEKLLEKNLDFCQAGEFAETLLAEKGLDIGTYDARMTLAHSDKIGVPDPAGDDPAMAVYSVSMTAVANSILKKKLNISFDRPFISVNFGANALWDFRAPEMLVPEIPPKTHIECLVSAMRRNPSMNLLIANGAYDLCTWTGLNRYLAETSGFPEKRTFVKMYPAGHAAFTGDAAGKMFRSDIEEFVLKHD